MITHKDFEGKGRSKKEIDIVLEKLKNRTPEEELKSRLEYCKEAIIDKKFELKEWFTPSKDWTHDHCEICGKHISDKKGADNGAYSNSVKENEDWICKECFNKYKEELGLIVK